MKKNKNIIASSLLSILIICSCASKKATVKAVGDVEITIPCSDFKTDKDYFRSSGIGTSKDLSSSVKQAEVKTKASLAGVIETKIKEVSKIYTSDRKIGEESEFSEKFQNDPKDEDLRNYKFISESINKYDQVFSSKHGYIDNLSIIDLIFNLGPEAVDYLNQFDRTKVI